MPLQNRVDPAGTIHAVSPRGMFTGNRGIIHDCRTKTLLSRRWSTKAWIICVLNFKGVRRDVMARRSWTEMFFLDEVTALAAGHRPCFYCRRQQARCFATCLMAEPLRARNIDAILHQQRLASGKKPRPFGPEKLSELPDGAMVISGGNFFAVRGNSWLPWSFEGYGRPVEPAGLKHEKTFLVTPELTCRALRRGYEPVWHQTAGS